MDYFIHTETSNTQFLKLHKILKDMGIKNNRFFLALYDVNLRNVNPFDPNLDVFTRSRVIKEICINPWYYIREVCRIVAPGRPNGIQFELHRGNLASIWCALNDISQILLMPRQHGKSIGQVCLMSWIVYYGTSNTKIIFFNKKFDDSKLNLLRLKEIVDLWPKWLQESVSDSEDINNKERIKCHQRENFVDASPAPTSKDTADKLGRGLTVPIVWFDEFAFIEYVDELYTAASPAVSQASINAKKAGAPTFKLISTTPNNIDSHSGKYTKEMINSAATFSELMYDMTPAEIEDYMEKESTNNFIHIEFSYRQLGRDDKWFKKQCRDLNNDMLKIKREILLEFTKASDTAVFTEAQLDVLEQYSKDTEHSIIVHGRPIHFLTSEIDYLKSYIIGVDVSGGLARDFSQLCIIDPDTELPVGYFYSNKTDTDDLYNILYKLITNWLPNAVLVIERNNYGLNIVQRAIKTNIERNIYYDYIDDPSKMKEGDRREGNRVRVYGFQTSDTSREQILDLLFREVQYHPERFIIPTLIREVSTLEYNKKGKIEHSEGCHDDLVFAYMFVRHVMHYSKTISKWIRSNHKKDINAIRTVSELNAVKRDDTISDQLISEHTALVKESTDKLRKKANVNILSQLSDLNRR